MVVSLTRHFIRKWEERVGAAPTVEGINRLMSEAVRVRKQMRLFRREGPSLEPVKVLALYWHHGAGVIIWIDEEWNRAVTVVSAHTARSVGDHRGYRHHRYQEDSEHGQRW
jgi:hypothetical protein